MLAVFERTVANPPEGLRQPETEAAAGPGGGGKAAQLVGRFSSSREGAATINLGPSGAMVFSSATQNPLLPRLFAAVDDIFCIFEGNIENVGPLKQQYGLSKTTNEVIIVIEAYKTLRDRGPYPADQVIRDLNGKFAFILFDTTSKCTFVATDADGSVPFFWGTDSEGHLVLSDDLEVVKEGCGKSVAPFPKGCFFTTSGGLQSFEHPLNEVKPMPRIDSKGEVCGATFKVDAQSKKETGMPRVGSAANWSSQF